MRRVGLVIEALSLLGYVAASRRPGGPTLDRLMLAGLVVGFSAWAAGTLMIYWPRRRPAAPRHDREDDRT